MLLAQSSRPTMLFLLGILWVAMSSVGSAAVEEAVAKELFLTSLIKSGELEEARSKAEGNMKMANVKSDKELKSYSGYLNINDSLNANLFFWFFPAQEKPETASVILWINDLPGYSCLKGVFLETGPFYIDEEGELHHRDYAWTKSHSLIYMDAPVGSGFSFAYAADAYARTADDEATEIYEALSQFFKLFKEFQSREFYLAGETYAGTSIPHIANLIHMENEKAEMKINLKGFILGTPWTNPELQSNRAHVLKAFGLIDEKQAKEFEAVETEIYKHVTEGEREAAAEKSQALYWGPNSLLGNLTGFKDTRNALHSTEPEEISRFAKFVESKQVHNYLHVGLHQFVLNNELSYAYMSAEFMVSHSALLEKMLDKGYRVLIYAGQFDLVSTHEGVSALVKSLKWKGADAFGKSSRKIWRVDDEVAGYVKEGGSLTYALVRNAGNYAIMDQPQWTYDLVDRFLKQQTF